LDQPAEASRPAGPEALQVQVQSLAGREIVFDSEGFLSDFRQWTEEVAQTLAQESGLEALTDTHWQVIRFLREYYLQNGRAPLHRELKKGTGMSLLEIESLFPGGIKQGARRLAGLPNPKTCGQS
jgi:tRNA 2-thiouridine synthesizing protein E